MSFFQYCQEIKQKLERTGKYLSPKEVLEIACSFILEYNSNSKEDSKSCYETFGDREIIWYDVFGFGITPNCFVDAYWYHYGEKIK